MHRLHGKSRRCAGATLLEMVAVIVILGIVAAIVAPVLETGFRAYLDGREMADRERQATLALERFVRDVRGADAGTVNRIDASQLTLERDGAVIAYRFDGGDLVVETDGGTARVLARGVANASFPEPVEVETVMYYSIRFDVAGAGTGFQATAVPRRS